MSPLGTRTPNGPRAQRGSTAVDQTRRSELHSHCQQSGVGEVAPQEEGAHSVTEPREGSGMPDGRYETSATHTTARW